MIAQIGAGEIAGVEPDHLATMLSYAGEGVTAVRCDRTRGTVTVEFDGTSDEWRDLVQRLRSRLHAPAVRPSGPIYAHRSARRPAATKVWDALVRSGTVRDFGGGHVAFRGLFLELLERLDDELRRVAAETGAEPVDLPNMLPLHVAKRSGVFDHHPHDLFFTAPLVADVRRIEAFQREAASGEAPAAEALANLEYCLKTSACAPLYPLLAGMDLANPGCYTTIGACARRETARAAAFERLTEFRMREIVFVGDAAGARAFEAFSLELFTDIIESFDLVAEVGPATDSFFVAGYSRYRFAQLVGTDKSEARVFLPDADAYTAFASFNHHRRFFAQRYEITCGGQPAVSACTGVGLERLVFGILSHCGVDQMAAVGGFDRLRRRRSARRQKTGP